MVKLTAILNWNGYHNIPKKYIQRAMFKGVVYENNHGITPPVVYNYTKNWIFDENAPWTMRAKVINDPQNPKRPKQPKIVPPLKEWFFFRGDKVQIMNGKDAGKIGFVCGIIRQRNWVIVHGLNCKLIYETPSFAEYGIWKKVEQPLVVDRDVKLIDLTDMRPCDVSYRFTEAGERLRVSNRTGSILPLPPTAEATQDYVRKSDYKPAEKDTNPVDLVKQTFVAKYKTFEQDLMDEYGIKETRQRAPTYYY